MAAVPIHVVHDTVTVFVAVHDTVRDTTVRVAAAANRSGITWRDWAGWIVTAASITVATIVSIRGWSAARRAQEQRDRELIREIVRTTLYPLSMVANEIGDVLATGSFIRPVDLAALDGIRAEYEQHWPKVYLWPDHGMACQIQSWYRDLRMRRALLGKHVSDEDGRQRKVDPAIRIEAETWSELGELGRALYFKLGFPDPFGPAQERKVPLT